MKKGVLLTIGMLFLSSIVLSLAVMLFHNTQGTENRFAELSLYDRLYDLDSSIQRGFKEIFTRNSGVTLTIENNLVTITETLPHSSNFASEMDAYEDYLEEAYPTDPLVAVDDSVLTTIKNKLPFYIFPHDILVEHDSFPSGDELRIIPQNLNIENYSISLTTTKQSVTFDDEEMEQGSGTLDLRVSVTTESGTTVREYNNINPVEENELTLNFDTGLPTESEIDIDIDDHAHLVIDREGVTADHTIEIALIHQAEEMNYIKYPDNLFTINIPGDNLQKTSTARIA